MIVAAVLFSAVQLFVDLCGAAALLLRDVLHRIGDQHVGLTNINGCILLLEVLFFQMVARRPHQPSGGPESPSDSRWWSPPWAFCCFCHCSTDSGGLCDGARSSGGLQRGGFAPVSDPMDFVKRTLPYIFDPRLLNSSILRQRCLLRPLMVFSIPRFACCSSPWRRKPLVAGALLP